MLNTFSRKGQLHYSSLITALVDDQAIQKGIIAPQNITPILFYFINLANNETIRHWLTDKEGNLKERHWLQCLNFLINEQVFNASTKSKIAEYLVDTSLLVKFSHKHQIIDSMWRPIPLKIEGLLNEIFHISAFVL